MSLSFAGSPGLPACNPCKCMASQQSARLGRPFSTDERKNRQRRVTNGRSCKRRICQLFPGAYSFHNALESGLTRDAGMLSMGYHGEIFSTPTGLYFSPCSPQLSYLNPARTSRGSLEMCLVPL